jgi:hypothetical protein
MTRPGRQDCGWCAGSMDRHEPGCPRPIAADRRISNVEFDCRLAWWIAFQDWRDDDVTTRAFEAMWAARARPGEA